MVTHETLKRLTAPLVDAEVDWRAQRCGSSDRGKYAFVVPYLNRLEIIDRRLDGILGPGNWRNAVQVVEAGVVATISILVQDEQDSAEATWISRQDGASFTDIEGFKGGISDAFKRTCVLWGIGHELYRVKELGIFGDKIKEGYPPRDGGDYVKLSSKNPQWYGWIPKLSIERLFAKKNEEAREKEEAARRTSDPVGDGQVPPGESSRYQGDESPRQEGPGPATQDEPIHDEPFDDDDIPF